MPQVEITWSATRGWIGDSEMAPLVHPGDIPPPVVTSHSVLSRAV